MPGPNDPEPEANFEATAPVTIHWPDATIRYSVNLSPVSMEENDAADGDNRFEDELSQRARTKAGGGPDPGPSPSNAEEERWKEESNHQAMVNGTFEDREKNKCGNCFYRKRGKKNINL